MVVENSGLQLRKSYSVVHSGAANDFFFCKVTVRRSKYCLEISKVREGLKMSGQPFHSPKIFGVFLPTYLRFTFYYLDVSMIVKKGVLFRYRNKTSHDDIF